MLDAIQSAQYSMNQDLQRLRTDSVNVANLHTKAYKEKFIVAQAIPVNISAVKETHTLLNTFSTVKENTRQGALISTGKSTDFAITGPGYFTVRTDEGLFYTRDGNFHVDKNGYLVTVKDARVQSTSGDISLNSSGFKVDKTGTIWLKDRPVAQLDIVNVPEDQLVFMGKGLYYSQSPSSNVAASTTTLQQGFLESSNVNTVTQITETVQLSRHFETAQRVLKAYDKMLDTSINHLGE